MPALTLFRRISSLLVLAAGLLLATQAQAAPEDGAVFKDWSAKCETLPEDKGRICHIFQSVSLKEKNQLLLNMAILYPPGKDTLVAIFTVPLGVLLPAGMGIQVDEGETTRFGYEVCIPQGCRAGLEMKPELVEALKKGRQAKVIVVDAKRRAAGIPISLMGITAAIESLK